MAKFGQRVTLRKHKTLIFERSQSKKVDVKGNTNNADRHRVIAVTLNGKRLAGIEFNKILAFPCCPIFYPKMN